MALRHVTKISSLTRAEVNGVLELALKMKARPLLLQLIVARPPFSSSPSPPSLLVLPPLVPTMVTLERIRKPSDVQPNGSAGVEDRARVTGAVVSTRMREPAIVLHGAAALPHVALSTPVALSAWIMCMPVSTPAALPVRFILASKAGRTSPNQGLNKMLFFEPLLQTKPAGAPTV